MMASGQFDQAFRENWFDDKQAKIDARLKRLGTETDPKKRKALNGSIARYKALITMGPERAHEAKLKRDETLRLGSARERR